MRALRNAPQLKDETGAAAVEFALIVMVLITIISAVIEFGAAYNELQIMTSAAREGARHAAVRATAAEVVDQIDDAAGGFETSEVPTVTVDGVSGTCTDDTPGEPVEVEWDQEFNIRIFGIPGDLTDDISATINGTFRCE
jgi:Flp pilus assembly protein TadG